MNYLSVHKSNMRGCLALTTILMGVFLVGPIAESDAFDTAMICAWKRTFHAHDALKTPLRGYFAPRMPNCYCWGAQQAGWSVEWQSPVGIEPAAFEQLGRIPNDFDLGATAIGAPPGR